MCVISLNGTQEEPQAAQAQCFAAAVAAAVAAASAEPHTPKHSEPVSPQAPILNHLPLSGAQSVVSAQGFFTPPNVSACATPFQTPRAATAAATARSVPPEWTASASHANLAVSQPDRAGPAAHRTALCVFSHISVWRRGHANIF